MPSPEFVALALLIVLVLAVALVNTWLLTTRRPRPQPKQPRTLFDGIPMPLEPFSPVPPPSEPQAVLDARYAHARRWEQQQQRRAAPATQRLTESDWYGSVGAAPWGGERDDAQWPQAR